MENYVWELTHALSKLNQPVSIICETLHDEPDPGIKVRSLGAIYSKPRYLYQLRFSGKVSKVVKGMNLAQSIVHSHERSAVHQVTTFHGPPFKNRKKRLTDFISPRIAVWEFLEKREICSPNVRAVLPNSSLIADQLVQYYPQCKTRIQKPALPGVSKSFYDLKPSGDKKTIGFIGREWKRKGLEFALEVVRKLQSQDPQIKFVVAGSNDTSIKTMLDSLPGEYENLGWADTHEVLSQIGLLIHPALSEPFGMVIAEANAAKIPVVVSNHCGIAPLIDQSMGAVLDLSDADVWVSTVKSTIQKNSPINTLNLTWENLARQHIELYRTILDEQ